MSAETMLDYPQTFTVPFPGQAAGGYDHHIVRTLSEMAGQYLDRRGYESLLAQGDIVVYEVYDLPRPEDAGDLVQGVSIVHPGKVGDEYFMTNGHFHEELETAEVYLCLQGTGVMVMENPDGEWAVKDLRPGTVLYIPPAWAHRSVNTSLAQDLVTFFVYPAHAGHDYRTIKTQGFRKIIVEREGRPCIVDNPRWRSENGR